jgi:hypothetical protein
LGGGGVYTAIVDPKYHFSPIMSWMAHRLIRAKRNMGWGYFLIRTKPKKDISSELGNTTSTGYLNS